jgi:hypothetical protein
VIDPLALAEQRVKQFRAIDVLQDLEVRMNHAQNAASLSGSNIITDYGLALRCLGLMFMHQHQALHADRPVETAGGHRLLKVRRLCKPFCPICARAAHRNRTFDRCCVP